MMRDRIAGDSIAVSRAVEFAGGFRGAVIEIIVVEKSLIGNIGRQGQIGVKDVLPEVLDIFSAAGGKSDGGC